MTTLRYCRQRSSTVALAAQFMRLLYIYGLATNAAKYHPLARQPYHRPKKTKTGGHTAKLWSGYRH